MTTRLSDVIRGWMGWCPQAQPRANTHAIPLDNETAIPPAGGSFRARAVRWLGLFRNQTLLQTIGTFCTGLVMFASLGGGWPNLDLFVIGMLAGLPISAIVGIWYLRIFTEVLSGGPIALWKRYDKTAILLTVVPLTMIFSVWALVLVHAIPGINHVMTTALFGGFISVQFWGLLAAIHHWESRSHCRLHYDGMNLGLEKDDSHALG